MGYDLLGFGYRLSLARTNKNLSQSDTAKLLGITQSAYSKIENGKRDVTISQLYSLSLIFNVSVYWLIGVNSIPELTDSERLLMEKFIKFIISIRDNDNK